MMSEHAQPQQGKSMKELRSIVEADTRRFDQLGELWSSLTDAEQQQLVDIARRMAGEDIDYGNT
jgi:catalase